MSMRSGKKVTVEEIRHEITMRMAEIGTFFIPGVKLTFIARHPGDDEADLLISNDDLDEIILAVMRSKKRKRQ